MSDFQIIQHIAVAFRNEQNAYEALVEFYVLYENNASISLESTCFTYYHIETF